MKGSRGVVKGAVVGMALASVLTMGASAASARPIELPELGARRVDWESARDQIGPSVGACWNQSVALVARSARGWKSAMDENASSLCVLPAPDAPAENWGRKGLVVVAYRGGLQNMVMTVTDVTRRGNLLMVDVKLAQRTDGCGYCDQDQIRIGQGDLGGLRHMQVRYTYEGETGSVAAESYAYDVRADDAGDPVTQLVSWGSLKASYR